MSFLIDAQLPLVLCEWLRVRGHSATHVSEVGLAGASDAAIAARAVAKGEMLITKDEDFVTLRLPDRFGLLWLRCGNASNRALFAWLEPRWAENRGEPAKRGALRRGALTTLTPPRSVSPPPMRQFGTN